MTTATGSKISDSITVGALFYGDHPKLAERCIGSIADTADWEVIKEVRIGLNAVSERSRKCIYAHMRNAPKPCLFFDSECNVYKYPLMRRMLYYPEDPVSSPCFMWFDDDSYVLTHSHKGHVPGWWRTVAESMKRSDMLGSMYRYVKVLSPSQQTWVRSQGWYVNGIPPKGRLRFLTGGWWTIRTNVLRKYDWPPPEIKHNGGDYMLGLLMAQQKLTMKHFDKGYRVNSGWDGRNSSAKRRGESTPHLGDDYDPNKPGDLSHNDFDCKVFNLDEPFQSKTLSVIDLELD